MHQTELWQRVDQDTLKIVFTFDDPKMYSKPWSITYFYKLMSNWVLDAHPCTQMMIRDTEIRIKSVSFAFLNRPTKKKGDAGRISLFHTKCPTAFRSQCEFRCSQRPGLDRIVNAGPARRVDFLACWIFCVPGFHSGFFWSFSFLALSISSLGFCVWLLRLHPSSFRLLMCGSLVFRFGCSGFYIDPFG